MITQPKASKVSKAPQLLIQSGEQAAALRKKLGINQSVFWSRIRVTQSGGSRYESGRKLPHTVQLLLHLAYASEAQAHTLLDALRKNDA